MAEQAASITAREVVVHRGRRVALEVEALDIPAGSVTAVVGPNGSGKSTLLHTIAGLLRPSAGELNVRGGVAYVLQATDVHEHLPVTVGEVVRMGRYSSRGAFGRLRADDHAAVDRALERLELTDLRRRPLGELSGGQRQRVFVAQGLAQDADVLLLDEPVNGLDLASVERIRDVVEEERAVGRTVVVATHDLPEASRADHVVLVAGHVVATGPPATALTEQTLAHAYGTRLLRLGTTGSVLLLDDPAHH